VAKPIHLRVFTSAYRWLAAVGAADEVGGAEYRRVRQEWLDNDRPANLIEFIRERANLLPRHGRMQEIGQDGKPE
jgi:hypothetical protein